MPNSIVRTIVPRNPQAVYWLLHAHTAVLYLYLYGMPNSIVSLATLTYMFRWMFSNSSQKKIQCRHALLLLDVQILERKCFKWTDQVHKIYLFSKPNAYPTMTSSIHPHSGWESITRWSILSKPLRDPLSQLYWLHLYLEVQLQRRHHCKKMLG